MGALLIIIVVAAVLLLGGTAFAAPKPPPPPPPPSDAETGGVNWAKTAGAIGGVAAAVGGPLLHALGIGGGAAAGGGAIAGGGSAATGGTIAGAGTFSEGTAGTITVTGDAVAATAEGGSAAIEVAGSSSVLSQAGVAGGLMFVVIVFWALTGGLCAFIEAITRGKVYRWRNWCNKRRWYETTFIMTEEEALDAMIDELAKRGTPSTYTRAMEVGGHYYTDGFQDAASLSNAGDVRALARWKAIYQAWARNGVLFAFYDSLGIAQPHATQQLVDGIGPVGQPYWNQNDQNSPGMPDEDFWKMVDDYVRFTAPYLAQAKIVTDIDTGLQRSSSRQPPAPLPERNVDDVTRRARSILGDSYDKVLFAATLWGQCDGMRIAAISGYSIAWPGDEAFTREVGRRCNVNWPAEQVMNASGEVRWVLREQSQGYAFDVVRSRETETVTIYAAKDLM